jgi:hypothetical protein
MSASPATVPFALPTRGAGGQLVGRTSELTAIRQELATARTGQLAALTLEGEPGIGKTRLLVAASELAAESGFATVAVTADEQLRGPFLVARSMLASAQAQPLVAGAAEPLRRAVDAVTGQDDPGVATLSPGDKLLRAFDLAAVAIRALADVVPTALLLDDVQWADEDSVRLLRYLVRTVGDVPIFLGLAVRPEEMAESEVVPLLADMERLGVVRRLEVGRMPQTESAALLSSSLGGTIDATSAATIHAQAEGVPFILEEVACAYQSAGLVQQIDGVWTLAKNAERLVPSAVRTLIQRRAARLPRPTRKALSEAAVVGRAFSLEDLAAVEEQLSGRATTATWAADLAETLAPAVATGLLVELPESAPADYRFAHEQVREFAADALTPAKRRAIHGALVDLLISGGEPVPESLPLLARHALEAGDTERAARFSIDAARAALQARAPEEALRLVERALPGVPSARERVALLTARDDALEMLRRATERLEGLAELAALAEALGDAHLALEVMLRRAGALRLADELEHAVTLATEVRARAARRGDRRAELAACLELGQAHLGKPAGESYVPSPNDADLDRAEEAFTCVRELAGELGDRPALALATRELGVIVNARVRAWYVNHVRAEGLTPLVARLAAGESMEEVIADLEIAPLIGQASDLLEEAIGRFEELGDQRGLMSSVIAMAYLRFAPDIHLQGSARRIEEIRHLSSQLLSLTRESERERAEAQMLYGAHVFARAKGVVDLALARGGEAFDRAHLLGEHTLEFLSAGGVAMTALDLGDLPTAEHWLGEATAAASAAPTPFKARQLALWRGRCFGAAGDAGRMRRSLERAVELAQEQRRPAARCEALARLALEAARLGARTGDEMLLAVADRAAADAHAIVPSLPGHPLWGAQADAARVRVALARADAATAADAARRAFAALRAANLEDLHAEIRTPVALGLLAGGTEEERGEVRAEIRLGLTLVAQRILDEDVRVRWFMGPVASEVSELVGPLEPAEPGPGGAVDAEDTRLVCLLVEGRSNRQMAEELGLSEPELVRRLAEFYARTGTGSRAQATTFAFREHIV